MVADEAITLLLAAFGEPSSQISQFPASIYLAGNRSGTEQSRAGDLFPQIRALS
ncbi:hypothetical protein [Aerosakkonema funiforme]|uniref:hypothetical protein n=1 Tax=Aerosakkonema funiforme TaxID=1246630 RepID=UPI0035BC48CF